MEIFKFLSSLFSAEPTLHEPDASINDIQAWYEALSENLENGSFVVFIPHSSHANETEVLNIQFSVESNQVGLDWVLASPVNIKERTYFERLCHQLGYKYELKSSPNCEYLRVIEGDLVTLCVKAIEGLYPTLEGKCLDLVVEGFELDSSRNGMNSTPYIPPE